MTMRVKHPVGDVGTGWRDCAWSCTSLKSDLGRHVRNPARGRDVVDCRCSYSLGNLHRGIV